MQFKIITLPEAGEMLAKSKIVFKAAVDRAYVHFAEHSGEDIIIIAPRGAHEALVIRNTNHDDPNEHGCNMHASVRQLNAIVEGTDVEENVAPPLDIADRDPSSDFIIVEG